MRTPARLLLTLSIASTLAWSPMAADAEEVGTSCADCPDYNGAFSSTPRTGAIWTSG